jgi:hypothetical protein
MHALRMRSNDPSPHARPVGLFYCSPHKSHCPDPHEVGRGSGGMDGTRTRDLRRDRAAL